MKTLFYLMIAFYSLSSFAQVTFSTPSTLIDISHYSGETPGIKYADLNNDGFKELIIASASSSGIKFYKNTSGNLQQTSIQTLIPHTTTLANYGMAIIDINGDGLRDIVVVNGFGDSLIWYQNLGNFNFSMPIVLSSTLDNPRALTVADMDNDGDNDILVANAGDGKVTMFLNLNNTGAFGAPQVLQSSGSGLRKIAVNDLDNNGFLDIVTGRDDGTMYWIKNVNGSNFTYNGNLGGSADNGTGFDFLDVNADGFMDIVICSSTNDKVRYVLNQNGNSFAQYTNIATVIAPSLIAVHDMDNDSVKDIVIYTPTGGTIGWYKNNVGTFSPFQPILSNLLNPREFVIEDIENDGGDKFTIVFYNSSDTKKNKVSVFNKNPDNTTYSETVLNFQFGAPSTIKLGDVNNDGQLDIVTGYRGIVWNENLGNSAYTSQKLISADLTTQIFYDIELKDINNDGHLDVVGSSNLKLEVYKNNGDETFSLVHSVPLPTMTKKIDVNDFNGDGQLDIMLLYHFTETHMVKIMNTGNFTFTTPTNVDFPDSLFKPTEINSADIDNDGDIDLVVTSDDYSRVQILKNDGTGNFLYSVYPQVMQTGSLHLADIDNDLDIDILVGDNDPYSNGGLWYIKNTNGAFGSPVLIDIQICSSLTTADINNDGFIDIVASSVEGAADVEKIFYYLNNNGVTFAPKSIVENLDTSNNLDRDVAVGDLNNDNKPDLVSSYYFTKTVNIFMNSSILTAVDFNHDSKFIIYPNPTSNYVSWPVEITLNNVTIYDANGKAVLKSHSGNSIDISALAAGLYYFYGVDKDTVYKRRIIVK